MKEHSLKLTLVLIEAQVSVHEFREASKRSFASARIHACIPCLSSPRANM